MGSHTDTSKAATLDLSRWRKLPGQFMVAGGAVLLLGIILDFRNETRTTLYSYLTSFMFFLSIGLGALFLVLLHHLFDAMWSVPIRRYVEHLSCNLFPRMLVLFIPIGVFASFIYPWMNMELHQAGDHALHAKHGYLNMWFWYLRVALIFAAWGWLTHRLRYWSLQQDTATATTSAEGKMVFIEPLLARLSSGLLGHKVEKNVPVLATKMMRIHAGYGIILFAFSLTAAAIDWVKSLEHQWFSTMYGVYYFAGSVWTTVATVYALGMLLKHAGPLKDVMSSRQFHDLGTLFFAFTVFYAYIAFSQYFLIWNAAIPEETFWYIKREEGSWWDFGMLIIFGHFFIPFLMLLRIDLKLKWAWMIPICGWAWLMHIIDLMYNILPVAPDMAHGPSALAILMILGGMMLMGGWLADGFIKSFVAHPPFPQKDPRMAETMGVYMPPVSGAAKGGAK